MPDNLPINPHVLLFDACKNDKIEVVREVIAAGANVNYSNPDDVSHVNHYTIVCCFS